MTRLEGKTILIVEDEGLIALDMIATFQAEGAGVIAASNVRSVCYNSEYEHFRCCLRCKVSRQQ